MKQIYLNCQTTFILVFFSILPLVTFSQTQIGSDIDGEGVSDFFGLCNAISADGRVVAIGAPFNSEVADGAGHVKVFQREGNEWFQMGETIKGENEDDNFGRRVDISEDGNTVIIGAEKSDFNGDSSGHARVYIFDGANWIQKGQDIVGVELLNLAGLGVSISYDGNIIAVGAPHNDDNGTKVGHVRIFNFQNDLWVPMGNPIYGEGSFDLCGSSISLSADGLTIAVSSEGNGDNGSLAGQVRVFNFDGSDWKIIGNSILGNNEFDYFGKALALSGNGSAVAIHSGGNDYDGSNNGYVQVYKNVDDNWELIGEKIEGEEAEDGEIPSRNCVAISFDGNIVVMGARYNDGNGQKSGHARIFINDDNSWLQIGEDIDGEASGDLFGTSVSISANGETIAIGARENSDFMQNAGHVRVYGISELLVSNNETAQINFSIYPNPASTEIYIQLEENDKIKKVILYNQLGQQISSSKELTLNTSALKTGAYFLEVYTNNGKASQKVIIE